MSAWRKQLDVWAKNHPLTYKTSIGGLIKPQYVVEQIYKITKGNAIITTEVGQNQMWAAQFYNYDKPRTFLTSGGLGTMGYGLPAAIGAQVAMPGTAGHRHRRGRQHPDEHPGAGHGGAVHRLPVKVVILNNGCLGMVRQWQELFFQGKFSETILPKIPDFVLLAEAYGAKGFRATKTEEVAGVLKKAFRRGGPGADRHRDGPGGDGLSHGPRRRAADEDAAGLRRNVPMRHTISILVENEFGVLSRVAGLFSGRGFNIESLCVAETEDPRVSRMTIVTEGNDQIVEQILKQLNKLIPVLKVVDFTGVDTVDRELVLVKVKADNDTKPEVLRLIDIFRAKVVDVSRRAPTRSR